MIHPGVMATAGGYATSFEAGQTAGGEFWRTLGGSGGTSYDSDDEVSSMSLEGLPRKRHRRMLETTTGADSRLYRRPKSEGASLTTRDSTDSFGGAAGRSKGERLVAAREPRNRRERRAQHERIMQATVGTSQPALPKCRWRRSRYRKLDIHVVASAAGGELLRRVFSDTHGEAEAYTTPESAKKDIFNSTCSEFCKQFWCTWKPVPDCFYLIALVSVAMVVLFVWLIFTKTPTK